jgi:hypothetical protein
MEREENQERSSETEEQLTQAQNYGNELASDSLRLLRINFYTLTIVIAFVAFSTRGLSGDYAFNFQHFADSTYTLWGMASWLGASSLAMVIYYNARTISWAFFGDRADLESIDDDPIFPTVVMLLMTISLYSFAIGGYEAMTGQSIPISEAIARLLFPFFAIYGGLIVILVLRGGPEWIKQSSQLVSEKAAAFRDNIKRISKIKSPNQTDSDSTETVTDE